MSDQQTANIEPLSPEMSAYRAWLITAEQKSQEDFDKTVLSLSGGALGISFVFLKDVVGARPIVHPSLLLCAWITWGISAVCVLASFYLSHLALRTAIQQVDDGTIHQQATPGGKWATFTAWLNALGGILFLVGVVFITFFVGNNIGASNDGQAKNSTAAQTTIAPTGPETKPRPAPLPTPVK